jgi:protein phosphatase
MLSTDGLHDYLSDDDINYYLLQFTENQDICHDMINQAIAQKSRDNLTVGLVRLTN